MGAAVVAVLIRREKEVVDDFRAAGADLARDSPIVYGSRARTLAGPQAAARSRRYSGGGAGNLLPGRRSMDSGQENPAADRDRLSVDTRPRPAGSHAGNLQVKRHAVAIQSAGSIFRQGIIFGPAHHGDAAAAFQRTTCLTS